MYRFKESGDPIEMVSRAKDMLGEAHEMLEEACQIMGGMSQRGSRMMSRRSNWDGNGRNIDRRDDWDEMDRNGRDWR